MLTYMKRTTVKLSDDLDGRLRHEAARRGVTIAEITRVALEQHLASGGHQRRRLLSAGSGRGPGDVAERIEELLKSELGADSHR